MIPIYIGISKRFNMIKGMTERSIKAHTDADIEIIHLYPEVESGCTGFSDVRYQIEYGIYLDCDMIVMGDIAELWEYRRPQKYVCMYDGSTEVGVIDFREGMHQVKSKKQISRLPRANLIPKEWNIEDYNFFPDEPLPEGIKNFHFTSLAHQPWLYKHPNSHAIGLYKKWANKPKRKSTRGRTVQG